ncbi:MAG TPA: hypothetical protein VFN67_34285 [Polyangiales bacterium]|nr:hypothetical protein [Polyangiales bacterium]
MTLITAMLHAGGSAHAQSAVFNVAPDCSGPGQFETIVAAVDGAMHHLAEVDKVVNSSSDQFNSAFANAFGDWDPNTEDGQWALIIFAVNYVNIKPLLTNTSGFTISSGPAPSWPVVSFRCATAARGDVVAQKFDGEIVLYPLFFDNDRVPFIGRYGSIEASRVGTVLHECIHLLGGPKDIEEGGRTADVQAEQLALDKDPRALSNAENYERFLMSWPFQ